MATLTFTHEQVGAETAALAWVQHTSEGRRYRRRVLVWVVSVPISTVVVASMLWAGADLLWSIPLYALASFLWWSPARLASSLTRQVMKTAAKREWYEDTLVTEVSESGLRYQSSRLAGELPWSSVTVAVLGHEYISIGGAAPGFIAIPRRAFESAEALDGFWGTVRAVCGVRAIVRGPPRLKNARSLAGACGFIFSVLVVFESMPATRSNDGDIARHTIEEYREGPEAVDWLRSNRVPVPLASNRFESTTAAVEFVEGLHQLGAPRVVVPRRCIRKEDRGEYADCLFVTLPEEAGAREAVLSRLRSEAELDGMELGPETAMGFAFLWWD